MKLTTCKIFRHKWYASRGAFKGFGKTRSKAISDLKKTEKLVKKL